MTQENTQYECVFRVHGRAGRRAHDRTWAHTLHAHICDKPKKPVSPVSEYPQVVVLKRDRGFSSDTL